MILGTQTLDSLLILATDVNPSTAGGIAAPVGSFGSATDGSGFFTKTGALDTDWSQVITSGNLLSSVLTGFVAGPNTAITSLDTILSGFQKAQGQINALSTTYLALAGGTMTGSLILNADAVSALGAVTLQQLQAAVVGVYELQQGYDASTNLFPTAVNTSPLVATIKKGFIWNITVAGVLGGAAVTPGDTVLALVDSPGQIAANWLIQEFNIGYTPLSNVLNSANIFVGNASNVATGVTPSGVISVTNTGVFSYVNASLNLTTKVTGILPIANGGTNSGTALNNNRIIISSASSIVELSAMTAGRVAFYDANGLPSFNNLFRWDDVNSRMGVGASSGSGFRLNVVGDNAGTALKSDGIGVSAFLFDTASTTLPVGSIRNIELTNTPRQLLQLTRLTTGAGAGMYIQFKDSSGTNGINGQFGTIVTDATAGTMKTAFIWSTPDETTETIVERMRLTSSGTLSITGSLGIQFLWDTLTFPTSPRLFIGAGPFVGSAKVFIQTTTVEAGLIIRSAFTGIDSRSTDTNSGNPSAIFGNTSATTTAYDILSLVKSGHAATIGSGNFIRFQNVTSGGATPITIGKYGMVLTNITSGASKSDHVWQTTSATDALVERMRLTAFGLLGIGTTLPTAIADLSASTLANASLRLRSGVAPTTPNLGDMWYDGTDYVVRAAARNDLMARTLVAFANMNFGLTPAGTSSDITITVTGASVGSAGVPADAVSLGVPQSSVLANSCYTAFVSAANTVTVRFNNYSAVALDPAVGSFKVMVFKN